MRSLSTVLTIVFISFGKANACSCGPVGIEYDVDRAYDIIVGKIIAEKEQSIACKAGFRGHEYEQYNSYAFNVKIDYSYKNKLDNNVVIHGGKGMGDCGAIFQPGYNYLIVVTSGQLK